jgi:hypothetical protein
MGRPVPFAPGSFGCSIALFASLVAGAHGAQWGTLYGRIVYDGVAPEPQAFVVDKDKEACGQNPVVNESLLVAPDGGVMNALVFLRTEKVDVAPGYEKTAKDDVVVECKECRFEPHLALLRTSQTLVIQNSDPVTHNTKAGPLKNRPFNELIPAGEKIFRNWDQAENLPVNIQDSIHSWMSGFIFVRSNPYAAVTDIDGKFLIKDLPAGEELEFQLWQERSGYLKDAKNAAVNVDNKGRFRLTLKPRENYLGDFVVSPAIFKK